MWEYVNNKFNNFKKMFPIVSILVSIFQFLIFVVNISFICQTCTDTIYKHGIFDLLSLFILPGFNNSYFWCVFNVLLRFFLKRKKKKQTNPIIIRIFLQKNQIFHFTHFHYFHWIWTSNLCSQFVLFAPRRDYDYGDCRRREQL